MAAHPPNTSRRQFIALAAATTAWPAIGRAQSRPTPVVGYLSSKGPAAEAGITAAIRKGLSERGFDEGRTLAFSYRWSEGDYSRLPELAASLIAEKVDVMIASGLPAALAAKAATATIPIVFRMAVDPVAFGLTPSLDRPGGNITGVTMLFDALTPKKLELLRQIVPASASVGFLVNPNNQNAASHRQHALTAAASLGFQVTMLEAGRADEIDTAFAAGRRAGIGALLVGDDPLFDVLNQKLVETAARHNMPTMYYVRDYVTRGGLISYGPSFDEMSKQVGVYVARILEGAKPAELPVQQPTKFELVINLKTAKAIGMQIPVALLARADEVIE